VSCAPGGLVHTVTRACSSWDHPLWYFGGADADLASVCHASIASLPQSRRRIAPETFGKCRPPSRQLIGDNYTRRGPSPCQDSLLAVPARPDPGLASGERSAENFGSRPKRRPDGRRPAAVPAAGRPRGRADQKVAGPGSWPQATNRVTCRRPYGWRVPLPLAWAAKGPGQLPAASVLAAGEREGAGDGRGGAACWPGAPGRRACLNWPLKLTEPAVRWMTIVTVSEVSAGRCWPA